MSRIYRSKEQARTYWQDVLKRWQASGLSIHRFCREHHITESSFYNWRKKLSTSPATETQPSNPTVPTFVQMDMQRVAPESQLTLELASGHSLHISHPVDSETLATVIHALCEAKLC